MWAPFIDQFSIMMGEKAELTPNQTPRDYFFEQLGINRRVYTLVTQMAYGNPESAANLTMARQLLDIGPRALVKLSEIATTMPRHRQNCNRAHVYEAVEVSKLIVRCRAYRTIQSLVGLLDPPSIPLPTLSPLHRPRLSHRQSSQQLVAEIKSKTRQGFFSSPDDSSDEDSEEDNDHTKTSHANSSSLFEKQNSVMGSDPHRRLPSPNKPIHTWTFASESHTKNILHLVSAYFQLTTGLLDLTFKRMRELPTRLARILLDHEAGERSPADICRRLSRHLVSPVYQPLFSQISTSGVQIRARRGLSTMEGIEYYADAALYALVCQECGIDAHVYVDGLRAQVIVKDTTRPLGYFWIDMKHKDDSLMNQPLGDYSMTFIREKIHNPLAALYHAIESRLDWQGPSHTDNGSWSAFVSQCLLRHRPQDQQHQHHGDDLPIVGSFQPYDLLLAELSGCQLAPSTSVCWPYLSTAEFGMGEMCIFPTEASFVFDIGVVVGIYNDGTKKGEHVYKILWADEDPPKLYECMVPESLMRRPENPGVSYYESILEELHDFGRYFTWWEPAPNSETGYVFVPREVYV